jgi:hypothetical protein
MNHPSLIKLTPQWVSGLNHTQVSVGNKWVPARPLGFYSVITRFKMAWLVFTGKADALVWPFNQ